ncbi:14 alpha-demethylase [Dichomitus squalens]|uniref:14 alpha-demethylase n=1 Tax=Dichomitus squalens TaxID=114155 RepID=A0A4Q9PIK3_9APHY|nr:14 alpha-demethylase [Dichomitus squalens]TBU53736.1 14 alpha-demethylase [Dichomitus squalens]
MLVSFILSAVNVCIAIIVINICRQLLSLNRSQPPVVWHWIPFLGSTISYGKDPVGFFRTCRERYGNCFTFILLGKRITVALGERGNDFVLGGKHTTFVAEDVYAPLTTPVFGTGVIYDCPNDKLMEQKKFFKASFTAQKLASYVHTIADEVKGYITAELPSSGSACHEWLTLSVPKTFSEITLLTASHSLQGVRVRDSLTKDYAQTLVDLDHGFTPLHWIIPGLPLPSYWRRDAAHARMSRFYQQLIHERRSHGNLEDHQDIITDLMQQQYRDGTCVPDHEIAHLMIAVLMAGQHTSASSLSWSMLHIAQCPDIQEALYQEQVEHCGGSEGFLGALRYEDLRKLTVLDSVIRETLRLHPPIHSIMRKARSSIPVPATLASPSIATLDSIATAFVVPKGDIVLASPMVSQLDPTIWVDPERWDPYRWHDEEGMASAARKKYDETDKIDFGFGLVSKGTSSPYLPFGAGKHRCIGEQFAYLQIGTIIATLLRHMEFRLEGAFPKPDFTSMMVVPMTCSLMYRLRRTT